jgi:hypothetical protein
LNLLNKLLDFLGLVFLFSQESREVMEALTFFKPKVLSTATFEPAGLGCSFFFGGMTQPVRRSNLPKHKRPLRSFLARIDSTKYFKVSRD